MHTKRHLRTIVAIVAALTCAAPAANAAAPSPQNTVAVRLIGLNDLHGQLEAPTGSAANVTLDDGGTVTAGGAAYLAAHVKQLESTAKHSIVLSGGDNVGASPLSSALFHDEPTIDFLNYLGTRASVVGNHDLDEGYAELRRMARGGCHPDDGCTFRKSFPGADFPFLAANMTFKKNHLPAAAPFTVDRSSGVPIGIIGAPLKDMASVAPAQAIKDLRFGDEAAAINRSAKLLRAFGVRSIVALLHQGDANDDPGGPNGCSLKPDGPGTAVANRLSSDVDVIFSAHSHAQYSCNLLDPSGQIRPFIQGLSAGRLLSVVDIKIDRRTREINRGETVAHNVIVDREIKPDARAAALVDEAKRKAAPIANRKVGTITDDLTTKQTANGESTEGDAIADAQLAATEDAGAQLALVNIGGIKANLDYKGSPAGEGDGAVTYQEAYAAQPFADFLNTITLTGKQLDAVLEQQYRPDAAANVLQPSATLHYTASPDKPIGQRVDGLTLDGKPVQPDTEYRVTVNAYLNGGGDGFTELRNGTNPTTGMINYDALVAYLGANPGLKPPPADRIKIG